MPGVAASWLSRWNSSKMRLRSTAGMPTPVSWTCNQPIGPRLRMPTRTPPRLVYLIALETRFCAIRRRKTGSLSTTTSVGTKVSRSSFASAKGAYSVARRRNSSLTETGWRWNSIRWLSSREMSRTAFISCSTDSKASDSRWVSSRCPSSIGVSVSADRNSRAADSGCNRSWLAARRKRVFERLASSALVRATASSRLRCDRSAIAFSSWRVRARTSCSSATAA